MSRGERTIVGCGPCQPRTLSRDSNPGESYWLWVGSDVGNPIPCSYPYYLEACGIGAPDPIAAQSSTWGGVKARFR